MMRDIENRNDIEIVLDAFYKEAVNDGEIGHFFTEVVQLDIQKHMPVIAEFWEAILFDTRAYRKNVMKVHQHIHQLSNIRKEHLDHWVRLFHQTLGKYFEGNKALLMKQRAQSIATLMDIKLNHSGIGKPYS